MKQRLIIVTALLTFAALLSACENSDKAAERFRARQWAFDPPQLWSIEATEPVQAGPITICTDRFVRDGFVRPLPNDHGKQCALNEPPTVLKDRVVMRCSLNGHDMLVRAKVKGDLSRDFKVDYVIKGPGRDIRQVRHHKLIGPCPAGWEIGDNTDRQGNIRINAMH